MILSHARITNMNQRDNARAIMELATFGLPLLKENAREMLGQNVGGKIEHEEMTEEMELKYWQKKYLEMTLSVCQGSQ